MGFKAFIKAESMWLDWQCEENRVIFFFLCPEVSFTKLLPDLRQGMTGSLL